MKDFFNYLRDRKLFITSFFVIISFFTLVSFFDRSNRLQNSNIIYVIIVSILLFIIFLLIDYFIHIRYYRSLKKIDFKRDKNWVINLPEPPYHLDKINRELIIKLFNEKIKELEEYRLKDLEDKDFLTSWIHQIKNPIAAIRLVVENDRQKNNIKTYSSIEEEIDRIEDFIQKFLYYSRLNDFSQDYIIEDVYLNMLINERVKRFSRYFIEKKIKLKLENLNEIVLTDRKSLGFIIDQIIANALKYTKKGGYIKISSQKLESEIILNIEDDGAGIKSEDLSRIFNKSFTGMTGRMLYNSTGMGLYLSRELAKKMTHKIEISSEFTKGTTVKIHFQQKPEHYYKIVRNN